MICSSHSHPISPVFMIAPLGAASSAVVSGECGDGDARVPSGLPDVPEPSAGEVARHNLTHLPYRKWCKWCVAARRSNVPHFRLPPFSRAIPLFVLDYCFIKHSGDAKFLTVLVGRLYPARALFAAPCTSKGPDSHCTARLASFFRACGISQMTFMCDQ